MRAYKSGAPMSSADVVLPVEQEDLVLDVPAAAPEHSAPGESASNGMAERAVQPKRHFISCIQTNDISLE